MKTEIYFTPTRLIYCKRASDESDKQAQVIILGNAYGIMPYQKTLANALAQQGFETFWFPFSGQPGSSGGKFSIHAGVEDLIEVINFISENSDTTIRPLCILAHCVSGLITMEYLKNQSDTRVKKVIFYGLLADPARLRAKAEKRLMKAGVRSDLGEWDWSYSAEEAAGELPDIPFLVCHADDVVNRRRASVAELEKIVDRMPNCMLNIFSEGYDRKKQVIFSQYLPVYLNWFGFKNS